MFDNDKEVIKELENKGLLDSSYKIIRWPKKQVDKELVLKYICSKIVIGKKYTEFEINSIIVQCNYLMIMR